MRSRLRNRMRCAPSRAAGAVAATWAATGAITDGCGSTNSWAAGTVARRMRTRFSPRWTSSSAIPLSLTTWMSSLISSTVMLTYKCGAKRLPIPLKSALEFHIPIRSPAPYLRCGLRRNLLCMRQARS